MHKDTQEALARLEDALLEDAPELNDEALDAISNFAVNEDQSDEMIDDPAKDEATEETVQIDPLEALISEIATACEAEAKETEEKAEADDKFDALSDAMFGGSKE